MVTFHLCLLPPQYFSPTRSPVALQHPGRAAGQRVVSRPLWTRCSGALPPSRVWYPGHSGAANPLRLEAMVGRTAAWGLYVAPGVGLNGGERHPLPQPTIRHLFH